MHHAGLGSVVTGGLFDGDLRDGEARRAQQRSDLGHAEIGIAPAQAVAASLGQYRGARDEAADRPLPGWA